MLQLCLEELLQSESVTKSLLPKRNKNVVTLISYYSCNESVTMNSDVNYFLSLLPKRNNDVVTLISYYRC